MSFDGINRRRQEKLKKLTAPVPPAPKKSTGNGAAHVTGSFVWGRATYPVVETPEMRALAASLPVGPSSPVAQTPAGLATGPKPTERKPAEPVDESQPFTVTRITNDSGLLAKKFWLKDGKLTKSTRAFLKRGRADRIKVDGLEGLTELLASLTHKQALAYGITTKKSVSLVTKDEQAAYPGSLARTNENFSWPAGPAILMLDHDAEHVEGIYTPETLRAVLLKAEPELAHAPMMWTASSSSYIVNADEDEVVIPLRGQRIYIPVVDGRDIPRVLAVIYERLWLAGFGCFIVSGSGRLLDRNIIDASVGQPERLDFAAGAMCVPPLEQRRPEPRIWGDPNVLFDTRRIADLTPQEHKDVEDLRRTARALRGEEAERVSQAWVEQHVARLAKRGVAPERAREIARAATEGQELTAEFQLVSKDGVVVTVGEVLDDPGTWHGKHFADPIEPGYRGDGRIAYANLQGGRPYIYSHAHGGLRYELARKSVLDEFADLDAEIEAEIADEALVSGPQAAREKIAAAGLAEKETAALVERVRKLGIEMPMPAPKPEPVPDTDFDDTTTDWTDAGNANLLRSITKGNLRYVLERKEWIFWNGEKWLVDVGSAHAHRQALRVSRYYKDKARKISAQNANDEGTNKKIKKSAKELMAWAHNCRSRKAVSAMLDFLSKAKGIAISATELDRDPWLLGVQNGVVDLRTGTLRPEGRDDFVTKRCSVAYRPTAKCPRWVLFIDEVTGSPTPVEYDRNGKLDPASVGRYRKRPQLAVYVQRMFGYCLTGVTREHLMFFAIGYGSNGKNAAIDRFQSIGGDYVVNIPPAALMVTRFDVDAERPTPTTASLAGARLAISSESKPGQRLDPEIVKRHTGDNKLTGRLMRENNITFDITHKLLLPTNSQPRIEHLDDAIRGRLHLMPFDRQWNRPATTEYNPALPDGDKELAEKLKAEEEGILVWSVEGAVLYAKEGLQPPPEIVARTRDYFREQDLLGQWLEDYERCEERQGTPAGVLFDAFRAWCREREEDESPDTQKAFSQALQRRGYRVKEAQKGNLYPLRQRLV